MKQKILDFLRKYDLYLILLLAFLVRMIGFKIIDYGNFPEFFRDYYMVDGITHGHLTLLGPPSMLGGFHFGPIYYYLMVPIFILFNHHPFGLIFSSIIFFLLTVLAVFKLVLLWSGDRNLSRLTALLTAFSVYSIHLSSYTSNPNFMPAFVLFYFYYLTKILQGEIQKKNYILAGIMFGVATQLHVTAMIVLPAITLASAIIFKHKPKIKNALLFLGAIILIYGPYIFYEVSNNFENIHRLFSLGANGLTANHPLSSAAMLWNFFEATITPFNNWYSYTSLRPITLYLAVAGLAIILAADFLYKFLSKKTSGLKTITYSKIGNVIFFFWLFFSSLLLLIYSKAVHDHYLIIMWPAPLMLLALFMSWFKQKWRVSLSFNLLVFFTFTLQIYSYYGLRHASWQDFYTSYNVYKNLPGISEIGSKPDEFQAQITHP